MFNLFLMLRNWNGIKTITHIMKQLILLPILFLHLSSQSQITDIFPTESGRIQYVIVKKVDSTLTKDQLFTLSKMWLASIFVDVREVILMEDKEAGIIMGKGSFANYMKTGFGTYKVTVLFRMNLKMNNGGYTFRVSDLEANYIALNTLQGFIPDNSIPKKNSKNIYNWRKETNATIETMIENLNRYIEKNKSDFINVVTQ